MTATIQIDYARDEGAEAPADRLLRKMLGWAAVVYGGVSLLQMALHIGLANGLLSRPANMSWSLSGGWGLLLPGAQVLCESAFLLGGALLLIRRSAVGVTALRVAAMVSVLLLLVGVIVNLRQFSAYASYWSKPATAAMELLDLTNGLWVPLLIAALTFRPPGRSMT
jgi:hypothetical protein